MLEARIAGGAIAGFAAISGRAQSARLLTTGGFLSVTVNTPPPERRWLQITAQGRIGPPSGGLR